MVGLNENKIDERIDMNQQNLNIKTLNHKIEKRTTVWLASLGFMAGFTFGFHVGFHNEVCRELGLIGFCSGGGSGDHSRWVL